MEDHTKTLPFSGSLPSDMPVCIRIIEGIAEREPLLLDEQPLVIGRERGLGLRLEAEGVSRRHAKITYGNGQYTIFDLESKNGTFVNWSRIDVAPLRPGDRIDIGKVALRLDWFRPAGDQRKGSKPEAPAVRHLLSARELEVAELVGRGMTNAEIGRTLGISRRTVATHLENAYQRLGIHSRAALVKRLATDDR
ncbi:MAG: FHA domain-containing protein [Myxococcota bacterium]